MINKKFDQIGKNDIDDLISNEVPESRSIDYKQDLLLGKDEDKKEFLADVSSFANASEGYLFYGIHEKREDGKATGIPEKAEGLAVNADQEIKRMDSLIRDGIEPRLIGCHIREIPGFPKGPVILVYVPKSWIPPHMVTIRGSSRFWSRTNKGKYPLDIIEIRNAVLLSENQADKIRQFRDVRLARIIDDETPVPLKESARIVVHILPISCLDPTKQIYLKDSNLIRLQPLGSSGSNYRMNFDGLLKWGSCM